MMRLPTSRRSPWQRSALAATALRGELTRRRWRWFGAGLAAGVVAGATVAAVAMSGRSVSDSGATDAAVPPDEDARGGEDVRGSDR